MYRFYSLFILLLFVAAPAISQEKKGVRQAVYHASETKLVDLIHTELDVRFDWENSALIGEAELSFSPHYRPINEVVLDAKSMQFTQVALEGETLAYTYDGMELIIALPRSFYKEDTLKLSIVYKALPEELEVEGSSAITEAKGLYFINPSQSPKGRMPQIWTQGETEASSAWFPTIDSPNQKHTQDIYIHVAPQMMALSNGDLKSVEKKEEEWIYHWQQDLRHAPYLTMMAVGNFVEIKDSVQLKSGRVLPLNYYVEPAWEAYAKDIFGNTGEMIQHFSDLLGVEFPWDKYSQIIVRNFVSGAMENTTAVIFGDFVYRTDLEALDHNSDDIVAHELFHHWFGDLLTCESWSNLPLNESFANYSQYLWDEFKYGKEVADYNAQQETFGFYNSAQFSGHHNMIWFDYEDKEDMFDGHSYNKGGRILHMLRNYLGDDLFFDAIAHYLKENSYQTVEIHNLRLAFEAVSGEDLNWFFNQWFMDDLVPVLEVTHEVKDNVLTVNVHQSQDLKEAPLYKFPLKFVVYTSEGNFTYDITIANEYERFEFPLEGELENFILDSQQCLLAEVTTDKPDAYWVDQYHQRENYLDRYEVLQAIKESSSDDLKNIILEAINDPFWAIRKEALSLVNLLDKEGKKVALAKAEDLLTKDVNAHVRKRALKVLQFTAKKAKVQHLCNEVLANDPSWMVKASALDALGNLQPKEALKWAKSFEKEQANTILVAIGDLYAEIGDEENLEFFVTQLSSTTLNDGSYVALLGAFTLYLKDRDVEVLAQNWKLYKNLAAHKMGSVEKYVPLCLRSVISLMEFKADQLSAEVGELRKNNDVAVANQLSKKLEKARSAIQEAQTYLATIQN